MIVYKPVNRLLFWFFFCRRPFSLGAYCGFFFSWEEPNLSSITRKKFAIFDVPVQNIHFDLLAYSYDMSDYNRQTNWKIAVQFWYSW